MADLDEQAIEAAAKAMCNANAGFDSYDDYTTETLRATLCERARVIVAAYLAARGPGPWDTLQYLNDTALLVAQFQGLAATDEKQQAWMALAAAQRQAKEVLAHRGSSTPEQPDEREADDLSDFPEGALIALIDLVMPLEDLPQSDRFLRMAKGALEAKRLGGAVGPASTDEPTGESGDDSSQGLPDTASAGKSGAPGATDASFAMVRDGRVRELEDALREVACIHHRSHRGVAPSFRNCSVLTCQNVCAVLSADAVRDIEQQEQPVRGKSQAELEADGLSESEIETLTRIPKAGRSVRERTLIQYGWLAHRSAEQQVSTPEQPDVDQFLVEQVWSDEIREGDEVWQDDCWQTVTRIRELRDHFAVRVRCEDGPCWSGSWVSGLPVLRRVPASEHRESREIETLIDYFTGSIADYHITNLRAALDVAPDTGDWHGELRNLLHELARLLPEGDEAHGGTGRHKEPNTAIDEQFRLLQKRLTNPAWSRFNPVTQVILDLDLTQERDRAMQERDRIYDEKVIALDRAEHAEERVRELEVSAPAVPTEAQKIIENAHRRITEIMGVAASEGSRSPSRGRVTLDDRRAIDALWILLCDIGLSSQEAKP